VTAALGLVLGRDSVPITGLSWVMVMMVIWVILVCTVLVLQATSMTSCENSCLLHMLPHAGTARWDHYQLDCILNTEVLVACGSCCLPQSLYQQVVQGIASARRLTPAEVESAINDSPLLASQAMQRKLVDGLAYRWGDNVPAAPGRLLCAFCNLAFRT
jgi:hypothetical protein